MKTFFINRFLHSAKKFTVNLHSGAYYFICNVLIFREIYH